MFWNFLLSYGPLVNIGLNWWFGPNNTPQPRIVFVLKDWSRNKRI